MNALLITTDLHQHYAKWNLLVTNVITLLAILAPASADGPNGLFFKPIPAKTVAANNCAFLSMRDLGKFVCGRC